MKSSLYTFISIAFFCSMVFSCSIPAPDAPDPGIVISWDVEGPANLAYWYSMRDQIQALKVPFTLYLRTPEALTPEQAQMLKDFQQDGHEIGYHTRFHTDAIVYILIEGHSIEEYVNYEIIPGLEDLSNNGIDIKNFSYPVAHHFTALDNYLLEHFFDSLRSVSPVIDWCYYKCDDNRVISAYWIDSLDLVPDETLLKDVYKALRKAKRKNYILNLYGHNIDCESRYTTALTRLTTIIDYARELGLQFYRMEDLFSNQ